MRKEEVWGGATNNFKLAVVVLLFFVTVFHIFEAALFPYQRIISDGVLLAVALLLVTYLWIQEVKDRHLLQHNYESLVTIQNRLKETNLEAIRSLALAEEAKDPYAKGHSERVAKYSCLIGRKLGFSRVELRILENAAILHDIGKMGIADSILHKKGKLNDDEWKIVKKHPDLGLDILSPLEFLSEEKDIIKYHHERYDGKGYPAGIKGEQIPVGSRILAITDAFDAMNSYRPYRNPLSKKTIISELKANSGAQFDPKIVDILLEVIEARNKEGVGHG